MTSPLRIETVTLAADAPEPAAKFYRWALGVKQAPDSPRESEIVLGWGKEDRLRVVDRAAGGRDGVGLRMASASVPEIAAWCEARGVEPSAARAPEADREAVTEAWPEIAFALVDDEALENRVSIDIESPGGLVLTLSFPIPKATLAERGVVGPYYRRSADWQGLELPGLLGVTASAPDPEAMRDFVGGLGLSPLEPEDEDGPLAAGEHQWIVADSERGGIQGIATVVRAARIRDIERTLDHLGADYRSADHRVIVADPTGRVVVLHGVRGAA